MKIYLRHIMIVALVLATALTASVGKAQTATPDKTLATIEAMPRTEAKAEMEKWLDATEQTGGKQYKSLIASLEEMLSEPTWDYHNEELFAKVMEHASTASQQEGHHRHLSLSVPARTNPIQTCFLCSLYF